MGEAVENFCWAARRFGGIARGWKRRGQGQLGSKERKGREDEFRRKVWVEECDRENSKEEEIWNRIEE